MREPVPSRRKILEVAHEQGPGGVVRLALYRLGIYRRVSISRGVWLWNAPRTENAPRIEVEAAKLERPEIEEYLAFRPDQSRAEIERRFELGHECWAVRHEGRLIGCSWGGRDLVPVDFLECDLRLAPDALYHYDEFVLPEHRRKRVLGAVGPARRSERKKKRLGPAPTISIVLPENQAAFRRFERWRSTFAAEIHQIRLGPFCWLFMLLDRDLMGGEEFPARFERRGRPIRTWKVEGPLGADDWRVSEKPRFARLRRWLDRRGLLRRRLVVCFPNAQAPRTEPKADLECGLLEPEDVDAYLALRGDQTREQVERRLAAGHRCYVGRSWDELIAASWIANGPVVLEDLGCELRPAADTALIYDDFVKPERRRRRLLAGLVKERSQYLRARGFERSAGLVAPENVAACQHVRTNQRNVFGELVQVSLGPWTRTRLRLDDEALAGELPPFELGERG